VHHIPVLRAVIRTRPAAFASYNQRMPDAPIDPRWPKVLSLAVHEFRTPMTVVSGYIRMLLKDRAGALTDQQRRLLEEAEKSCERLSALVSEVSELSNLEAGTLTYNKQRTDLRAALRQAVEQLPPLADREVAVDLELGSGEAQVEGDPVRLAQAFAAVFGALRRELVTSDRLIVRERETTAPDGSRVLELHIGEEETVAMLDGDRERPIFDEWRGGVGLSLPIARRVIEAHGGQLWGTPQGRKTGARILIPVS
jgi:two-component system cell cycle sensor histidine kinase PleC